MTADVSTNEAEEREELGTAALRRHLCKEAPCEGLTAAQHDAGQRSQNEPLEVDREPERRPKQVAEGTRPPVDRALAEDRRMVGAHRTGPVEGSAADGDAEVRDGGRWPQRPPALPPISC